MTAGDLSRRAGISYRKLDHWIRMGYVPTADANRQPGSGQYRTFPPGTLERVLEIIATIEEAVALLESKGLHGHARKLRGEARAKV